LEELYPNLPDGLLSGIPATPDFSLYYMLTANLCKIDIFNSNLKNLKPLFTTHKHSD